MFEVVMSSNNQSWKICFSFPSAFPKLEIKDRDQTKVLMIKQQIISAAIFPEADFWKITYLIC